MRAGELGAIEFRYCCHCFLSFKSFLFNTPTTPFLDLKYQLWRRESLEKREQGGNERSNEEVNMIIYIKCMSENISMKPTILYN